jgi:hypothetical protein
MKINKRNKQPRNCSICKNSYQPKYNDTGGTVCPICYPEWKREYYRLYELNKRNKVKKITHCVYCNTDLRGTGKQSYCSDCVKEHTLKLMEKDRRKKGVAKRGKSGPEKIIFNKIKEIFPDDIVINQDRKTIKNPMTNHCLELDIFNKTKKFAIEVNGPTHYMDIYGEKQLLEVKERDMIKEIQCKENDIKLISVKVQTVHDIDWSFLDELGGYYTT